MVLVILACLATNANTCRTFEFPAASDDQRQCIMQGFMAAPELMRPHPGWRIVAVGCGKRGTAA